MLTCIKGMLGRKQDLIRNHLSGKRANQGAKAVIGGDTSLKVDQVGVPEDVSKVLTKPVRITSLNYEEMTNLVKRGKFNHPQKGNRKISLKFCALTIDIGDVAHVKLTFGDWVVLNRQPTLHKPSMMGFRVVSQKAKPLRLIYSAAKPFNADFDGDEVNMHVPQNPMAIAEVKNL